MSASADLKADSTASSALAKAANALLAAAVAPRAASTAAAAAPEDGAVAAGAGAIEGPRVGVVTAPAGATGAGGGAGVNMALGPVLLDTGAAPTVNGRRQPLTNKQGTCSKPTKMDAAAAFNVTDSPLLQLIMSSCHTTAASSRCNKPDSP